MQVEYDEPPHPSEPAEAERAEHQPEAAEDGSEPEEQEGEDRPKKKRVIKSRQSLAEKSQGTTIFPLARVKRIIKADKDLDMMSTEATFLVAVATEYFIKHFMEEGCTKARLERRRIVNYKDLANVVSRSDEFDFLADVVPLPITLSEALEKRKQKQVDDDASIQSESGDEDEEEKEQSEEKEESKEREETEERRERKQSEVGPEPPRPKPVSKAKPKRRESESKPPSQRGPATAHGHGTRLRRSMNAGEAPVLDGGAPPEEAMVVDE